MTKLRWIPGTGGGTEVIPDDWADKIAEEWLDKHDPDIWHHRHSLANLLREMRVPIPGAALDREALLAEVQALVAEVRGEFTVPTAGCADATAACEEIIARLEKLK